MTPDCEENRRALAGKGESTFFKVGIFVLTSSGEVEDAGQRGWALLSQIIGVNEHGIQNTGGTYGLWIRDLASLKIGEIIAGDSGLLFWGRGGVSLKRPCSLSKCCQIFKILTFLFFFLLFNGMFLYVI